MLNAVAQAVVAWDLDGQITYLNDAARAMYGWPRQMAVGTQATEVSPADIAPEQLAVIADTLAAGTAWTGEITVGRPDGSVMPVWVTNTPVIEGDAVVGYIGVSLDITERKAAEALVWHRATHDALTELANHRSLTDQLSERMAALAHGERLAVVLVDLGTMEAVADTFGHAVGLDLVVWGAERIAATTHEGDLLARFSDHTIAVCCSHGLNEAEALGYGTRLRNQVRAANGDGQRPNLRLRTAAAIATVTSPTSGADDLLQTAATALTLAKRNGSIRVYDSSMRLELERRRQLEDRVAEALTTDQVSLGYQPIIRLDDQVTVGAEALLRLTDGDGGPLPAIEVVRAAERAGRMPEFGELILRQACADAAGWQRACPDRSIAISVNVSTTQLDDPRLAARVEHALTASGLEPSSLWLEITESTLMRDPARCRQTLTELKAVGVRLSADDFGTGYSSLAYLKSFPLDIIKIDQSFVAGLPHNLEDFAIVQAILALSDALGLSVVAEGIESEAQLAELRDQGTPYGQGYLWSEAIPSEAMLTRLGAERVAVGQPGDLTGALLPARLATGASPEDRVDSVLGLLSHEIRSPLTVIAGYASDLQQHGDPEHARAATNIYSAAMRLERILANLVDATEADSSALDLQLETVDIVDLVEQTIRDLSHEIDNPMHLVASGPAPCPVVVDQGQIQQALHNLIGNASKFSPDGAPITLGVDRTDAFVDVTITDSGPGIEPGQLGLVFRKYGRASKTAGGTGIGLFLARHIARSHGGDVLYRRRTDAGGSTLVLRLPNIVAPT
ncbi:EAL domain-containing protein [Aquihabitans sp. G128]|uniref:EAL domain-containing protein n=1 Tax=Aquihabitans sp. G128 TaxID=2849779 RepID=UPI001C23B5E5|nr:EAL domain-containing protein [Aquihabitans sp. G128]QXC60679.1 EAL domain-containing protein [Aquihabitans sp. G128]